MEDEDWRVVNTHPKYAISESGRVKNRRTEKLLSDTRLDKDGYPMVFLYDEVGRGQNKKPHRLVVELFDGPIPDELEVNHVNGIKNDNRRENLEVTDHPTNLKHAYDTGLHSSIRPVCCVETGKCFPSMTAAAKDMNIAVSGISNVVAGKIESIRGFHFKNTEEEVIACGGDRST